MVLCGVGLVLCRLVGFDDCVVVDCVLIVVSVVFGLFFNCCWMDCGSLCLLYCSVLLVFV